MLLFVLEDTKRVPSSAFVPRIHLRLLGLLCLLLILLCAGSQPRNQIGPHSPLNVVLPGLVGAALVRKEHVVLGAVLTDD